MLHDNGRCVEGNFVVNTCFKVINSSLVLGKLGIDAGVLNIGNGHIICEVSCLMENGFSVNTLDGGLRNVHTSQVIACSVK